MFKLEGETIENVKIFSKDFERTESSIVEEALQNFIRVRFDEARGRIAFKSLTGKNYSKIEQRRLETFKAQRLKEKNSER
jgi:hypothetical protein